MSNIVAKPQISAHELALVQNDLSKLNPHERLSLYNKTCESLGLNPLTQPFGYIEFRGGKLSLYAKKDCTDQLRKLHGVSVEIVSKETIADNFVVIAKATDSAGRSDEDMGSVSLKGLSGEALGNAMMKAITKAKRRVTLSICGLGLLDETETETIRDAKVIEEKPPVEENKQKEIPQFTSTVNDTLPAAPIVNHAIPDTNQRFFTDKDVAEYRLPFTWGTFRSGMTFQDLGVSGTKQLLNNIREYRLKADSAGKVVPQQFLTFDQISKLYLARFE